MISNISITPIKNMLKSALNIHNFSFKSHTSNSHYWHKWCWKINAYQHYSRH
ncbi:hypothetical protein JP0545_07090 [Helicobacter pylori]|nr:hypothetical protein JP0061_08670 [Helicobacter pylori]